MTPLSANFIKASQFLAKTFPRSTGLLDSGSDLTASERMLVIGVTKYFWQCDFICKKLIEKPLNKKNLDIYFLILISIFLLLEQQIADHTIVNQAVIAAKKMRAWSQGLVNGVLRKFIREREKLLTLANQDCESRYNHPQWLIDLIKRDWSGQFEKILANNNAIPPLFLRINTQKIRVEEYCQKLKTEKIEFEFTPNFPETLLLSKATRAETLPGFKEGEFYIQDAAAQLAVDLLELETKQKILDACAAPGGKLSHILQRFPDADIIGLEKEEKRIALIKENLARLKLQAKIIAADAAEISTWWDGKKFDRILLDAPCSSLGVIRRHPDIKHSKRPEDIVQSQAQQMRLIKALWPLLKSDGIILYCTCSIAKQENDEVIKYLLENYSDVSVKEMNVTWGTRTDYGVQIIPGEQNMDGLFYAKLQKKP